MDSHRVGERQVDELTIGVLEFVPVDRDADLARRPIAPDYKSHFTVEDAQLIVVASLDYAVSRTQHISACRDGLITGLNRVEQILQHLVQLHNAERAFVHRGENHAILDRIEPEFREQMGLHTEVKTDQEQGVAISEALPFFGMASLMV